MSRTVRGYIWALTSVVLWLGGCDQPEVGNEGLAGLNVGAEVVSIGLADGAAEYILGQVTDILVLPNGRVVVADRMDGSLRLFSRNGQFLQRIGRKGKGPGEFQHPIALALYSGSQVLALDAALLRISVYDVGNDSLAFVSALSLPLQAHDVCTVGTRIFLLGLYEDRTVHEISLTGDVLQSFGRAPPPGLDIPGPLGQVLRNYNAHGELVCAPDAEHVVVVPYILPVVRAYDRSGRLLWETSLEDYHATRFIHTEHGSLRLGADEESGTVHQSWGASVVEEGLLAITLEDRGWTSRTYEVRLLDLADGREIGRLQPAPGFISLGNGVGWSYEEEPFPRLAAIRLTVN